MDKHLRKHERGFVGALANAGLLSVVDDKPFEHVGHYGTAMRADRCDFDNGVVIVRPNHINTEHFIQDIMEIAAWHAIHIHPNLNGFSGYDCIRIVIKQEDVTL